MLGSNFHASQKNMNTTYINTFLLLASVYPIHSVATKHQDDIHFQKVVPIPIQSSSYISFNYSTAYLLNITDFIPITSGVLVNILCAKSNIQVGLTPDYSIDNYVNGTSLSIFLQRNTSSQTHSHVYFKLLQNCSQEFFQECLVTAEQYIEMQPVPGACNLVHSLDIYPMLDVESSDGLVSINFSPANVGVRVGETYPVCDSETSARLRLVYDIYVHFLDKPFSFTSTANKPCNSSNAVPEDLIFTTYNDTLFANFDADYKIGTFLHSDKTRYFLATYQCSVMLTYVVVRDPNLHSSARYTPTFVNKTVPVEQNLLKGASIFSGIVGLFLCLFGHRVFTFELIAAGWILFQLICVFVLEALEFLTWSDPIRYGVMSGVGLFGGFFVLFLWINCGRASLFSVVIGLAGGYIFASIIFLTPLANLAFFTNRSILILAHVCLTVLYVLALTVTIKPHRMCVCSSALTGSYLVVASIGSGAFLCSILGQFLFTIIKKMVKKEFINAVIVFPMYQIDYILIALWAVLFLIGVSSQHLLTRKRPPFPLTRKERAILEEEPLIPRDAYRINTENGDDLESHSSVRSSLTSVNYEGDVSDDPPDYAAVMNEDRLVSRLLSH